MVPAGGEGVGAGRGVILNIKIRPYPPFFPHFPFVFPPRNELNTLDSFAQRGYTFRGEGLLKLV
jgi:hypothetical protein